MSGLIAGLVLRTPITEVFNTEAKFIATVYADHAWEDGTHAYPAVETVAKITGLSVRTVQRYLRVLEGLGMLIRNGHGARGTNRYDFPIADNAEDGSIRLVVSMGDTQSPRQPDGGDTVSGDTVSGDTGVTQTNNPSLVLVVVNADIAKISEIYEHEFGAITAMIRDAINDAVDTYPPDWIPEAMQIAVESNVRTWKYVEGILRNCKAKNIRPSLNKLEDKNANNNNQQSVTKRAEQPRQAQANYTDADRAAAERVKQRRAQPEMP
jgi:DnaD/phage-associated family protein